MLTLRPQKHPFWLVQRELLLIEQKDYKDEDLPKRRTLSTILNRLGYRLRKVKKTNR
jgi:hypothetical protein